MKTVDAGAVPVAPARLNCITTDHIEAGEIETVVGVTDVWSKDISEHIGLAATCRTRTCAPEKLEIEIRLGSVVPVNGDARSSRDGDFRRTI